MKAAKTDTHPNFQLMKQSDIVSFFHLQMPRWLFSHEKYKPLSLEAKVAYTFLLNRFQLSRLNGWVNDNGEVFVIFTRESLANEMQITYKKSIAAFKELVGARLIWEKRVGRGNANQIYLALVELVPTDAEIHTAAPFGNEGARPAETAPLDSAEETIDAARPAEIAHQQIPDEHVQTCQKGTSAPAETAHSDMPDSHPSKKEKRTNDMSDIKKVCLSVSAYQQRAINGQDNDSEQFDKLLECCELWVLPGEAQGVFQNAIERLYYSSSFTVGRATLPQARVRPHLWRLNGMVLEEAYHKLRSNTGQKVKNSTAYVMSTLFNAIHEGESDLMVDPYLNAMCSTTPSAMKGAV